MLTGQIPRRAFIRRSFPLAVLFALASCSGVRGGDGGQAIADAIRAQSGPNVALVRYENADIMDAASLWIVMRQGATRQLAIAFVCDVVQPAIAAGNPPPDFTFFVWDLHEDHLLADTETLCPAG